MWNLCGGRALNFVAATVNIRGFSQVEDRLDGWSRGGSEITAVKLHFIVYLLFWNDWLLWYDAGAEMKTLFSWFY